MLRLFLATAAVLGMFLAGPAGRPTIDNKSTGVSPEGVCPQIYAPVICDHGKIYPNQCEADQHHAKNCVPYGV